MSRYPSRQLISLVAGSIGHSRATPVAQASVTGDHEASLVQVIVGMLLTVVAFKFVINAYIPAISYLTLMDKYLISGVRSLRMFMPFKCDSIGRYLYSIFYGSAGRI